METTSYITILQTSPIDAEENRPAPDETHCIVSFNGREHGTALADWLDNSPGLKNTVCCLEFEDKDDSVRIDLRVPFSTLCSDFIRLIRRSLESYCHVKYWDKEIKVGKC
ncbi:MAG: hypothetical protein IJ169_04465 [Paludibacteraceae bacterium]|nr:hypothetical protein [Paludibacteraceae bacterium]